MIQYTEVTIINDQYPVLTSSRKGIFFQKDYYDGNQIASENNIGYNIVPYGYFTYRHMSDDEIFYFNINNIIDNGIVSTLYPVFTTNNRLDSKFLQYELNFGREFRKYSVLQKQGGSRTYMYFNKLRDLKLTITTSLKEQECIRDLICSIDHLITLHHSKSFGHILEAMVSCTLSWEQRKLGEIGSVAMCRRIFKYQTTESGDIPFFKIGSFGGTPDAFISKDLFESFKVKYPYPEKGDVLISASGSIGRTVVFTGKDEYFQDSNIVWLKHNNSIINSFLNYLYSTVKWAGIEGTTIKRLYNDNILKTEAIIPTLLEQQKISDYLDGINYLITLHQLEPFQLIFKAIAHRIIDYAKSKPPRHTKYEIIISFIKYYV